MHGKDLQTFEKIVRGNLTIIIMTHKSFTAEAIAMRNCNAKLPYRRRRSKLQRDVNNELLLPRNGEAQQTRFFREPK